MNALRHKTLFFMNNNSKINIPFTVNSAQRSCAGCTKCCEGWLNGTIYGHSMHPGKPCHYVNLDSGCSIYSDRPSDPCVRFSCQWLVNQSIPEWLSPSKTNAIIVARKIDDISYYDLSTTGQPINEDVLSWYILWGTSNQFNISWSNRFNYTYYIGDDNFTQKMSSMINQSQ